MRREFPAVLHLRVWEVTILRRCTRPTVRVIISCEIKVRLPVPFGISGQAPFSSISSASSTDANGHKSLKVFLEEDGSRALWLCSAAQLVGRQSGRAILAFQLPSQDSPIS